MDSLSSTDLRTETTSGGQLDHALMLNIRKAICQQQATEREEEYDETSKPSDDLLDRCSKDIRDKPVQYPAWTDDVTGTEKEVCRHPGTNLESQGINVHTSGAAGSDSTSIPQG